MIRRWFSLLLGVTALLSFVHFSTARNPSLLVNEAAIKLSFNNEQTDVTLTLVNNTGESFAARVLIELLDPLDKVRSGAQLDRLVKPGVSTVIVPLALPYARMPEDERRELPWYRLRYRIAPAVENSGVNSIEGVVSVSGITPDLFDLRVLSSRYAREGSRFRARVRTAHPVTLRPVKNVSIAGEINFVGDSQPTRLIASAATDVEGIATLDFELPRDISDEEGELKVVARRGILTQKATSEVKLNRTARVLITTDKPLYQPGQMLHVRALVFDSSEHALGETPATFKINDPEGTTVFRTEMKTSRFGVASVSWPIPENTRLGDYFVGVELDDERYGGDSSSSQHVRISRYDLPNFSVSAKPDRAYYLNQQRAEVEVRGDYLFGQPVKRARVRVVRQTERSWNYSEQKYDTEEGAPIEGDLDDMGRFVARIDLTEEHKDLADSEYKRFSDLDFAAYVTNLTTNRTEQRHFALRVTKEPIHVYVTGGRYQQASGLPLAFYVSTSYADGTPAPCEVAITEVDRVLVKIKTNRYGVAKVIGPVVARREDQRNNVSIKVSARDREGRTGHYAEDFSIRGGDDRAPEIRVETDKTIYRAGEPVRVEITASEPEMTLFVDVAARDQSTFMSKRVRLRNGRAGLTLPYTVAFKDRVTISASTTRISKGDDGEHSLGTRAVVFPHNRELKLDVHLAQTAYRPGEEASASLDLRAPDGDRIEGALGVVVFDKAVEERARTDQEFSSAFGFGSAFRGFWYGSEEIAGVTPRDIERLDLAKSQPFGLDVVAELLFNGYDHGYDSNISSGSDYETNQRAVFSSLLDARLKPLKNALDEGYEKQSVYPSDELSLRRLLSQAGVDFNTLRDPWGMALRARSPLTGRSTCST